MREIRYFFVKRSNTIVLAGTISFWFLVVLVLWQAGYAALQWGGDLSNVMLPIRVFIVIVLVFWYISWGRFR